MYTYEYVSRHLAPYTDYILYVFFSGCLGHLIGRLPPNVLWICDFNRVVLWVHDFNHSRPTLPATRFASWVLSTSLSSYFGHSFCVRACHGGCQNDLCMGIDSGGWGRVGTPVSCNAPSLKDMMGTAIKPHIDYNDLLRYHVRHEIRQALNDFTQALPPQRTSD